MSADTPKCAKLNHLKITISGEHAPLTHKQCIVRPPILSKIIPSCLNIDLLPLMYALDLCRQSNYHYCFADKVIICTLSICCY